MSATTDVPALREIQGPAAFGGSAKRFFDLTWLMAVTEFKLIYFGTAFGYLWSLIRPLLLFAVLYVVFTSIIRFNVPNYAQSLLLGLTLYTFFSESTTRAVRSVVSNENIVRKTQFPRVVIPLSVVTTGLFNLCLNLIVVLVFITVTGVGPRLTWLALPLIVAVLAIMTTGASLLLSALFVRFRDVFQIWGLAVLVLFYASPVLWPVEKLPDSMQFLLFVNPFAPLLVEARLLIIGPPAPSAVDAAGSVFGIIAPALIVVCVCAIGLWAFVRADDPNYFFADAFADWWRPEVRRLILVRLHAQADLAAREHSLHDPFVVVKEPNGSHGADFVMSILTRSRMIFLLRDGRDVIDSMLHAQSGGWLEGRGGFGRIPGESGRLEFVRRHSRLWVNRTLAVERAYAAHPPELRIAVRYEDLRADTMGTLRALVDWLGAKRSDEELQGAVAALAFEAYPARAKGPTKPLRAASPGLWRENMSDAESRSMNEIMGATLERLGYEV